ncbi:uncharacterized protein LOC119986826 [Tripterygium wilfordii]|uniref:uncharacterized protein LOC119986826 n=1 Tax=Tripterygium wilfordii TaxID=458696 RepID=UPI0018F85B1B|nr:uncharacterized protein LOC119986826 [Tripterygium wilfordii]
MSTIKTVYNARQKFQTTEKVGKTQMQVVMFILHPYIMHIQDIKPDGNYGFRAIAVYLGLDEDAWATIRYNLIEELHIFRTQYVAIFGSDGQWTRVYNSLNFFTLDRGASIEHWMAMSDMDLLIASKFNVKLHILSAAQSFKYFTLRSTPPPSYQLVAIAIGYVNNNHYVQVVLTEGYPMPPIMPQWVHFRHDCATTWATPYAERIHAYM